MIGEFTNHVWQATVFAAGVAVVTLAFRKNRAAVRYWLWLSASLKFLVPFSLLMSLGTMLLNALPNGRIPAPVAAPAISRAMLQITRPFPETLAYTPPTSHTTTWIPIALFAVWFCGFSAIALFRFRGWLQVRAAVRASAPINLAASVPIRASSSLLEPGVVGLFRPILLLPEGILKNLTQAQLVSVLAHEQTHVQRRDNLTAALHMIVEAIFWFHPFVWWIGARLVEERERACDEAVVSTGNEPRDYAEGILNVCKSYMESPLRCVSGVTGADLKKRIVRIMTEGVGHRLDLSKRFLLAAAGLVAIAVPMAAGLSNPRQDQGEVPAYHFEVSTIKPNNTGISNGVPGFTVNGYRFEYVRLRTLIMQAYGVQTFQVLAGPSWIDTDTYSVNAKMDDATSDALSKLRVDELRLAREKLLQGLLEERFGLKVHRETKAGPVYFLVIAKGGAKLHESQPGAKVKFMNADGTPMEGYAELTTEGTIAHAYSASKIARFLSYEVKRPVIDKTGLGGTYDFKLEFQRGLNAASQSDAEDRGDASEPGSGLSIFTAIQEQLGLKLQSGKGTVEVIVIDHIERPSEN